MDPKCSYNCILLSLSNNVLLLTIPLVVSVKMCIRLFVCQFQRIQEPLKLKKTFTGKAWWTMNMNYREDADTCFFARYKRISMRSCYWSAWGPNNKKCCRPRWHATLGSIITVYFALKALNNDLLRRFADAWLKKPRNIYFLCSLSPPPRPLPYY